MRDDSATRRQHEDELAAALLLIFQQQRQSLAAGRLDFGTASHLYRNVLVSELAAAYVDACLEFAAEHGIEINIAEMQVRGQQWANEYAARLADELTDTTAEIIRDAAEQATTYEEMAELAKAAFEAARAESIAITETTAAITAGAAYLAMYLNAELAASGAAKLVPVWNTAEDDKVCDVCGPLDHQQEDVYIIAGFMGPPAHPNCRCYLTYEPGSLAALAVT